jgi:hypothetical protein
MANPKTLSNNTAGVLFTDRRKFYINPQSVAELQPDVTPFLTFLIAKGARGTNDPDFKMFEHRNKWLDQHFSVNDGTPSAWGSSGAPGGTVTVAVDTITGVSLDDGLIGKTVEILDSAETTYKGVARVDAIDAGANTVTLRAIGNAEASDFAMSALADNDIMYVQGTAYGEGTTAPESSHDDLDVVYNSCQIFKTSVEVTGTLKEAALRGYSNELARLRRERAKEHKIQIERSLLYGTRQGTGHSGTANDKFATTISDPNGNTVIEYGY